MAKIELRRALQYWGIACLLALLPLGVRAQSEAAPPDSAARSLIQAFARAWALADATTISTLFTRDADVIIPTGMAASSREAIRAFYAGVFRAGYAGSTSEATIVRIRSVSREVAVVDAKWSIVGAHDANGGPRDAERGILTAVIAREGSDWKIAALREQTSATDIVSPDPVRER